MNAPSEDPLVLAAVLATTLLALVPVYHLGHHLWTRSTRHFSYIPAIFGWGLVTPIRAGAAFVAAYLSLAEARTSSAALGYQFLCFLVLIVFGPGWNSVGRLVVHANTGKIRWIRATMPPYVWQPRSAHVDRVGELRYEGHELDLFGTVVLRKVGYDQHGVMSGSFSSDALESLAKNFNTYLKAFQAHDTQRTREQRAHCLAKHDEDEAGRKADHERAHRRAREERERSEQRRKDRQARKAAKERALFQKKFK